MLNKQPQEKAEMQPILVSYPMELIHLDFLTLGGKAGDTKSTNILVVTDHFTKYAQAYINSKTNCNSSCLYFMGELFSTLWMARENTY